MGDNKGNEFVAVVEFAPNQKIGMQKDGKRKDPKINSIEQDPDYMKFLEILEKGPEGTGNSVEQTLEEIETREREAKAGRGPDQQLTPLLQFLKEKKDEKIKKREEMKDLRKKKEEERKMREKRRDKNGESLKKKKYVKSVWQGKKKKRKDLEREKRKGLNKGKGKKKC